MEINIEIINTRKNINALRRILKNEVEKMRQLKFNRKMRDKRRK